MLGFLRSSYQGVVVVFSTSDDNLLWFLFCFFLCTRVNEFDVSLQKTAQGRGLVFTITLRIFTTLYYRMTPKVFEIMMISSQMPTSLCKLADLTSVQ